MTEAPDREMLAKAVATCVEVQAWSGLSEPRRMACRQAVGFVLADLTAQGFVLVRQEDAWDLIRIQSARRLKPAEVVAHERIRAALIVAHPDAATEGEGGVR